MEHPVWRYDCQMPPGHEFEIFHPMNTEHQPTIYQSHHFYELYFILQGTIHVIAGEQDLAPTLGDVLIYPPSCMHRVSHKDHPLPYERFYLYLSREYLQSVSTPDYSFIDVLDDLTSGGDHCFRLGERTVLELQAEADEIIDYARDTSPAAKIALRCRMTLYLLKLLSLLEKSAASVSDASTNRMNELIRYINQNAAQPLSLDHLEQTFGISKYVIAHHFKDYTGMTVYQYILTRRVFLAKQLIRDGVKPRMACQQCGFTDYTNFYRAFKARTGLSPTQYNKSSEA